MQDDHDATTMLDVAARFLPVDQVLAVLEEIPSLGHTRLRLRLTGPKGWRIRIDSWPALASEQSYTKAEYRRILQRAGELGITVIPEIAAPGGMGAALASYPELGASASALDTTHELAYRFLDDVIRELAIITRTDWIGIAVTRPRGLDNDAIAAFQQRVGALVERNGKTVLWPNAAPDAKTA